MLNYCHKQEEPMLHLHLREYPKAITTITEINEMLEAQGITAVDCVSFSEVHEQLKKRKQYIRETETGYKHSAASVKGMKLDWSLVYYNDDKRATSLFVEVKCTFFDNPLEQESQAIIARYHAGLNEWWFKWTNLTPDDKKDISSDLASEMLFVNGLDIAERDEWAIETADALKLINTMATLYKLQPKS